MKIAIIGAGVSGLSCAYELERNGVKPTIFEKRSHIGDGLGYTGFWSNQFTMPYMDALYYLKKKYGLNLNPLSKVKELTMYSPSKKLTVKGSFGYTFKRGIDSYSLENQIASNISTPVMFDSYINSMNDIKNDFSHIVVAAGSNLIPKELGIWNDTSISQVRAATVIGNFQTDTCCIWFNIKYANNFFAYLIPNSEKEASLVLTVNNIVSRELDYFWDEFIKTEHLKVAVIQTRDAEYTSGYLDCYHMNNMYFIGNCAGFTDSFMGIGAFNAIESGILAARAIINNLDYNRLTQPIQKDILRLNNIRCMMNTFDNGDLDQFTSLLKTPLIKQLVYKNPFFKFKHIATLAQLYNKAKDKK